MPRLLALLRGRKFGSLFAGLGFLAVSVSGVLSFLSPYTERLAGVHTIAGFAFVVAAAFHFAHNGATWVRYVRDGRLLPSAPFVVTVAILGAVIAVSLVRARPVEALLAWGAAMRSAGAPKRTTYDTITLDRSGAGPLLTVDVKAGPYFLYVEPEHGWEITPQIAVWTQDEAGRFLETLYVTRDEGRAGYDEKDEKHTLSPRPAALPVWAHRLGVQRGATPLLDRHAPAPDVVSAASPEDNVYLVARAHVPFPARFAVLLEVNSSFDYNDYYRRDSFPDEPAYAEGGNPAQPSVVYRAWIEPDGPRFVVMTPIGHGHHAGADGRIDPDLSRLTTALDILERVVVDVRRDAAPSVAR
jgi:hypothetical protein